MHRNWLRILLLLVVCQASSGQYHPPYVVQRTRGDGKLWLGWNLERRQGFAQGYLWAYGPTFQRACLAYYDATPPETSTLDLDQSPLQKCMLGRLNYSKPADYYEAQITAYYKRYPTDVDLPIVWLFQAFSDSENKTPEHMHSAWERHTLP